ncbi:mechanosensitive ion channel family protein [Martelella lutilitoris]|uniref:Mechanosensitive ion channel family protein n=2 Tax=Martelella lutilitoris TaxID=2583532 RepID=A0A7T7HGV9_9HYPH|nr:mechanosensitive ion channel family protein [Martelella lutilitoris]
MALMENELAKVRVDRPVSERACLAVVLSILILLFLGLAALATAAPASWTGAWDSRWFDGGARVYMQQDGTHVTGRYPAYNGRLEGEAEGRRLVGTWATPKGSGSFEFILSEDGSSFVGRLGNKQWWTGARISTDHDQALRAFQSSPSETLRTFLIAAEAVESGRLEYQDDLLSMLIFPEGGRENHARELAPLVLLLDQFTVDPDIFETKAPEADEAELVLTRFDGRTLPLQFRRVGEDWFMVAPQADFVKELFSEIAATAQSGGYKGGGRFEGSTPRAAMESFVDAMRAGPAMQDTAIAALDLSEMPTVVRDRQSVLVAEYLNEVIARIGEVVFQEIPNDPGSLEPFVYFTHPAGDIVLAPTETDDGVEWKFTPETVRSVRGLYAATENLPPSVRVLPYDAHSKAPYFRIRAIVAGAAPAALQPVGPLEAWQWAGLVAIFIVAVVAALVVGLLLSVAARLGHPTEKAASSRAFAIWGFRLLAFGVINYLGFAILGLPSEFGSAIKSMAVLMMIAGAIPIEFWLVDRLHHAIDRAGLINQRGAILASLLVGVAKVLVVCANILLFADALSIPYGAAIAGLGISGIAIAFAARSTLENVISAFILFVDRPVDVNDLGRFDGRIGTIEHIGLRATVIRTLDRTLLTIPNSDFISDSIENFTRRDSVLMRRRFALRPETGRDQLRYLLTEIRRMLIAHPKVLPDPARVRLLGISENRIEYEIFAYIRTVDYSDFLAIQEDVILRMMDIVEKSGSEFASPARTLYLARDRGIDADKGEAAEQAVAGWRDEGKLPFPNLAASEVSALRDTLDFPPEGAPPEDEQYSPSGPAEKGRERRFGLFRFRRQ